MDHRRDPGPLKAPDTTGVGHDCDDNGEDGGGGGGGVEISSSMGARASAGERVPRRSRGQFSTVRRSSWRSSSAIRARADRARDNDAAAAAAAVLTIIVAVVPDARRVRRL